MVFNFIGIGFGNMHNGFYITICEVETEMFSRSLLGLLYMNGQLSIELLYSTDIIDWWRKL